MMNLVPGEPSRREVNAIDNSGATQNSGNVTVNDNSQTTVHAPGEPQLPMLIVAGVFFLALVVVAAVALRNGSAAAPPPTNVAAVPAPTPTPVLTESTPPDSAMRGNGVPAPPEVGASTPAPLTDTAEAPPPVPIAGNPDGSTAETEPAATAPRATEVGAGSTEQPGHLVDNGGGLLTDGHTGSLYVRISAGEFTMGAPGPRDQQPVRQIYLDEFAIKLTEVTNAEYGQCVAAGVCAAPQNTRWNDPAFAEHPIVNVRWEDADTFARWVGGSLPTEAQWEKACRGAEGNRYPWGSTHPDDVEGNFDNWIGDTFPAPTVTGDVSPYGALNMAGNVREWVSDWYWSQYYGRMPDRNPPGPSEPTKKHTIRGGAFNDHILLTCVVRHSEHTEPATRTNGAGFRSDKVGFRVVLPVN